jgi:hypothetical protein
MNVCRRLNRKDGRLDYYSGVSVGFQVSSGRNSRRAGMSRPTQEAELYFRQAEKDFRAAQNIRAQVPYHKGVADPQTAFEANNQRSDMAMAGAMAELCAGLRHLSEGLRATYLLIEQRTRN